MSYRDRTRKQITLPSGATCVIRKLRPNDFLSVGSIPTIYPDPQAKKQSEDKTESERWAVRAERVVFTKCISKITFEGKSYTVVDKPFGEATENEIEIVALEPADSDAIINEVAAFSGLDIGKEGGSSEPTFQSDGARHDTSAPDGESLRPTAINNSAPESNP